MSIHRYVKTPDGKLFHEKMCEHSSVVACDFCADVIPDDVASLSLDICLHEGPPTAVVVRGRAIKAGHCSEQFHICLACAERRGFTGADVRRKLAREDAPDPCPDPLATEKRDSTEPKP